MLFRLFIAVCLFLATTNMSVAGFIDYPTVQIQALDKSTARTVTLEAAVGTTIEYGSIFIKVQSCRESEPLDTPESASFLQIWEVPLNSEKSEWVFSGWMFASSPALSAMDHPVYDVWVLDCLGEAQLQVSASEDEIDSDQVEQSGDDSSPRIIIEEDDIYEDDELSDVIDPLLN